MKTKIEKKQKSDEKAEKTLDVEISRKETLGMFKLTCSSSTCTPEVTIQKP